MKSSFHFQWSTLSSMIHVIISISRISILIRTLFCTNSRLYVTSYKNKHIFPTLHGLPFTKLCYNITLLCIIFANLWVTNMILNLLCLNIIRQCNIFTFTENWSEQTNKKSTSGDQSSLIISGLSPATTYEFRLYARNQLGMSDSTDILQVNI